MAACGDGKGNSVKVVSGKGAQGNPAAALNLKTLTNPPIAGNSVLPAKIGGDSLMSTLDEDSSGTGKSDTSQKVLAPPSAAFLSQIHFIESLTDLTKLQLTIDLHLQSGDIKLSGAITDTEVDLTQLSPPPGQDPTALWTAKWQCQDDNFNAALAAKLHPDKTPNTTLTAAPAANGPTSECKSAFVAFLPPVATGGTEFRGILRQVNAPLIVLPEMAPPSNPSAEYLALKTALSTTSGLFNHSQSPVSSRLDSIEIWHGPTLFRLSLLSRSTVDGKPVTQSLGLIGAPTLAVVANQPKVSGDLMLEVSPVAIGKLANTETEKSPQMDLVKLVKSATVLSFAKATQLKVALHIQNNSQNNTQNTTGADEVLVVEADLDLDGVADAAPPETTPTANLRTRDGPQCRPNSLANCRNGSTVLPASAMPAARH